MQHISKFLFYKKKINTQEEARQYAIDWQSWVSEQSISWGDVMEWQAYFLLIGEQFDLVEEFIENGIL